MAGYLPETAEKNIGKLRRNYPELYGKEEFNYDREQGRYICPAGQRLRPKTRRRRKTKYRGGVATVYAAGRVVCWVCPEKWRCTKNLPGRTVARDQYEAERLRLRQKLAMPEGRAIYGRRNCLVEPVIGHQLRAVVINPAMPFLVNPRFSSGEISMVICHANFLAGSG